MSGIINAFVESNVADVLPPFDCHPAGRAIARDVLKYVSQAEPGQVSREGHSDREIGILGQSVETIGTPSTAASATTSDRPS